MLSSILGIEAYVGRTRCDPTIIAPGLVPLRRGRDFPHPRGRNPEPNGYLLGFILPGPEVGSGGPVDRSYDDQIVVFDVGPTQQNSRGIHPAPFLVVPLAIESFSGHWVSGHENCSKQFVCLEFE